VRFEARFLGPLLERDAALTELTTRESPRGARRNPHRVPQSERMER
jgi:hypothetical protein